MTRAVTINLDDAQATELERIAAENGITIEELVGDLIEMLALERGEGGGEWVPSEEDLAAMREGDEAIKRGDLLSHEEVMEGAQRIIDGQTR